MKVVLTLAVAFVAVAPATAGAVEPDGRIYGGGPVAAIADVPFQAALVLAPYTAASGQFCGGAIRDTTHVITAAHCVYDNPYTATGQAIDPATVDVLVGTVDLGDETPPAQRVGVSAVSFAPGYGSTARFAYDAAVLTLEDPLTLGGAADAAILVTTPAWAAPHPFLHVSGWGLNDGAHDPDLLREVTVPFEEDADCDDAWGSYLDAAVMVCAGDGLYDSCNGDSGGPLSVDIDAGAPRVLRLAGIVSFGPASGCANPSYPGVYTEIDGPVRPFVDATTPVPAPRITGSAGIAGTAQVGDVLTCSPGTWSGSPTFSYLFMRGATLVRGASADASYTVQPADAGGRIWCEVKATNAGGYGYAGSGLSATVPTPTPAPALAPTPVVTPPVVPARPPVTTRPIPPADRTAPVARIAKVSCKRSRCTLDARVTDAGFSSGVRRVEVKLVSKYRASCMRGKRRVPCTRIRARALRAASLDVAGYRVRVTGLPAGRHSFTLRAVDVAGNRQAIPARRTVTTGRR